MKILVKNIEKKKPSLSETQLHQNRQMPATVMTPSQGGGLDNQPLSMLLLLVRPKFYLCSDLASACELRIALITSTEP